MGTLVTHFRRLKMPIWGSLGRPSNPVIGEYGLNAETGNFEVYDGDSWKTFAPTA
jgi:hypothetical protein